jgi:phage I-like protein
MTTQLRVRTLTVEGSTADPVMVGDTLWSHAATLGRYKYGEQWITLDRGMIESFVKNFSAGYPKKVPVDYEHGSGIDSKGQPVPKAGDVLELRGVFAESDFTGDLKTAADKLAAKSGRSLSDSSSFGLWMRWRPLALSLAMVKAGEYTEHSIEFSEEYTSPLTGEKQGPTLFAVALTNRPFLDGMIPIAASRGSEPPPAAPAIPNKEPRMAEANVRLLTAVAAITLAAAPTDEDQAEKQLSQAIPDINRMRTFAREVAVELGESEATPAVDKIKKLKAKVAEYELEAEKQKVKRVDATIATVFKDNENKLLPLTNPVMKFYVDGLRAELMAGKDLDKTDTMAAIKALKPHGITSQSSTGDEGKRAPSDEDRLLSRAKEIRNTDEEVKELTRQGKTAEAWDLACDKAEAEFVAQQS